MTFVISHPETLDRLSREGGSVSLRSLADRGAALLGDRFVRVCFDSLAYGDDAEDCHGGVQERQGVRPERTKFDHLVQPMLAGTRAVVVVVEVTDDAAMARFVAWLTAFAHDVQAIGQADQYSQARWRLVVIATTSMSAAIFEALEKVRAFRLCDAANSPLFSTCHLMTESLRAAGEAGGIEARVVWPEAVGELLLHIDYSHRAHGSRVPRGRAGSWYRAWQHVRLLPMPPAFLDDAVRSLHAACIRRAADERPQDVAAANLERLDASLHVAAPAGNPIESFEMLSRNAIDAAAPRWDADGELWSRNMKSAAVELLRARTEADLRGPAGGEGRSIRERIWSQVHSDRSSIDRVAGGGFAQNLDLAASTELLGDRWLELFRFDAAVRDNVSRLRASGEELQQARNSHIAFRWRIVIAGIVCVFLCFAIESLNRSLGVGRGFSILAACMVGVGATSATALLAWLERERGAKAATTFKEDASRHEAAIRLGFESRLGLAASADEIQRWSARIQAAEGARQAARRLKRIVDRATLGALSETMPEPSGLNRDERRSLSIYRDATRIELAGDGDLRGAVAVVTGAVPASGIVGPSPDPSQRLDGVVESISSRLQRAWADYCNGEDPQTAGRFRARQTWQFVSGETLAVRSEIVNTLVGLAAEATLRERLDALARAAPAHSLVDRQIHLLAGTASDDLDALSVRTSLSSGSGTLASNVVVWVRAASEGFALSTRGSVQEEAATLAEDTGAIALAHHDVELDVRIENGTVTLRELSVNEPSMGDA